MARALNLLTRRATLGFSVGAIAMMACGRDPSAAGSTEQADLEAVFAENGLAGTFVLYDVAADHLTLVDGKRAGRRFVPASTFKIANTIIALETGVVKDENEIIPYGGQPQPFKTWEKDMSMRGDRAVRGSHLSGACAPHRARTLSGVASPARLWQSANGDDR